MENLSKKTPLLQIGTQITVTADKWVQNGYSLAHHKETPIFIHGALPGETINAEITKVTATHVFAICRDISSPSQERIQIDCSSFPSCGACSFRHFTYSKEFKLKSKLLCESEYINIILNTCKPKYFQSQINFYRNFVQVQHQGKDTGFFGLHSNKTVPFPGNGCLLPSERLQKAIQDWDYPGDGKYLFRETASGILYPDFINEDGYATEQFTHPSFGTMEWKFPAKGFFQINRFLWPEWLSYIREILQETDDSFNCLELFAGNGLIGGYCRDILSSYTAFDSSSDSLKCAKENFEKHDLIGKFYKIDLYKKTPDISKCNLLIVNPPRSGLKKELTQNIISNKVPWILYSSCNPATLNRDLGPLLKEGKYRAKNAAVFDFFPRTPHVEVVVLLER